MTTQDFIEDVITRLRGGSDPRLVYITASSLGSCEVTSTKADRILQEHESLVVGIYDRKVKPSDLREDIEYRLRFKQRNIT